MDVEGFQICGFVGFIEFIGFVAFIGFIGSVSFISFISFISLGSLVSLISFIWLIWLVSLVSFISLVWLVLFACVRGSRFYVLCSMFEVRGWDWNTKRVYWVVESPRKYTPHFTGWIYL